MQQGLLSGYNPSDALPAPRYTGMLLPIERDMYGNKGNFEMAVPQFLQDAYSGINKFGQAFRGELSPQELQQLATNTAFNVAGGSLLGSRVIPNAVPKGGILGMGVSKTPNQTGLLGKVNKSSNIFGSVEKFPKLSKQEENLVSSSFAPVNEVAGFGKVKIEKINNQDLVGSQKRFEELKKLTANYAHDRAKARVIRLDNGENAIQYMQPPTEIKNVNISDLIATQDNIVLGTNKSSGSPLAVKKNGKLYIRDGHHRIAQKINAGDKTTDVRVIDLDEGGYYGMDKSATNTPKTGLLGKNNEVIPENGLLGKVDNVQPKSGIAEVVPPTDKADGIFAFHGSGADFDEFKLSKIGTGEGNQAFGYGLYFTDSEDIAKFYKNQLRKRESVKYKEKPIKTIADANFFDELNLAKIQDRIFSGKSFNEAKSSLVNELEQTLENFNKNDPIDLRMFKTEKKALDHAKSLKEKDFKYQSGKTYEVKINAVMDDLIDYDKSLRQQNDKIKKILKPYYEYYSVAETADFGTLLESTYRHLPQDEFSERLAKEGIKGIKYKSGQLSGITDSKATNYVIFDDKIIDIMKKYGIVGAVGVTAMQGRGNQSSEANLSL